jgi:hypothetical protein
MAYALGGGRVFAQFAQAAEIIMDKGAQFFAVAGKVYELTKERGLGRELPTEWFLQDIRD